LKSIKIAFITLVLVFISSNTLFAAYPDFDSPVTYVTGTDPRGLTSGDFNGDGSLDLATANSTSNDISILINNGDGTFQDGVAYNSGGESYGITNADFNNDGKLDLAVANYSNAEIAVLLGNGNGTFQNKVTYTAGAGAKHVLAIDLNGDNKVDLACANYDANTMSVLMGNGDGSFQPKVDYTTGDMPRVLTSGDFDKDGKVDLITINNMSHDFSLFKGNGDGTFQDKVDTLMYIGEAPRSIASADFDKDGNLDVVTANVWGDNITILMGNGDGSFQPAIDYTVSLPNCINIGDFNGDNLDDIIVTGTDYDDTSKLLIFFFMNNGDGTFTRGNDIDFSDLDRPFWMVAEDLNNDGYLDLATTHYNETLNVWLKHVDKAAPLVSFSPEALPDSSYVKGTISIPAYAIDDDSGVKDLSLFENDNLLQAVPTDSYNFSVDTTTLTDGARTFKVLASDKKINTSSVERNYIVDNTSPTVDAGSDTTAYGQFTQDATASDTNGIASYQWSQQSGPGTITFGTPSSEDTTVNADQDGLYTARLTVTDNAGNQSYDEFTFTWDTTKPTVDVGTDKTTSGQFTQNATANSTNGIASYQWSQQSGTGTINFGTPNAEDTTITADQDGTYTARLTVTDNAGNSTYDEMTLVWDTTNPTADAGTDKTVNAEFTQDATASDTVGIATYQWSQQSGPGTVTFGSVSAEDTTVEADVDGTYVLKLTVTDNAGNSFFDVFTLVWDTTAPVITSHSTPTFSTNISATSSFSIN
jgi:hypothetical protein